MDDSAKIDLWEACCKVWLGLGVLVLFEYLLISYLFDAASLYEVNGWWSNVGYLGRIAPVFFLGAAAAGLLRGKKIWERVRGVRIDPGSYGKRRAIAIMLHLLAYAAFLLISFVIFRHREIWEAHPQLWVIGWLSVGLVAGVLLWPAFFPRELSGELLMSVLGGLALGLVVGVLAWQAGLYTETLWGPLQSATLSLVAGMLRIIVGDIVYVPAEIQVGTPQFWVTVAPVCSGYEGIGLITVFIAAYVICFRKKLRFPQALLLFPLSMLVAFLCNGLRITALILVGAWVSPEVAMGGFHSKAGTIFFCAIALSIVYFSNRSRFFCREVPERLAADEYQNPTAAYLMPLMGLLAVSMLSGLFLSGNFNYLYPVRIPVVLFLCWWYRGYFVRALAHLKSLRIAQWFDPWSIACGVGVFVIWMLLEPRGKSSLELMEAKSDLQALSSLAYWGWIAARIVGSVLLVPVIEELFFRGYLLRRLVKTDFELVSYRTFTWLSLIGSSLAFGVLHQRMVAGTIAGLLFAVLLYRRGELRDPIVAHAVANGLIALAVLAFDQWALWL